MNCNRLTNDLISNTANNCLKKYNSVATTNKDRYWNIGMMGCYITTKCAFFHPAYYGLGSEKNIQKRTEVFCSFMYLCFFFLVSEFFFS